MINKIIENVKNNSHSELDSESTKKAPKLRFKADDGSEFPDWEEKKLGDVGKVSMCKRVLKDQTDAFGEIPFYKIGTFGKQADAFITKDLYNEYKSKYSYPSIGDILISASGTIGRTAVYDGKPAYYQDSNIVWIANNEKFVYNKFLLYCYSNVRWQTEDTTIARLYNDNLRGIKINLPTLEEQTKIADCLSIWDDSIENLKSLIENKKLYKKGMMQKLFSQEIRFKADDGSDFPDWEEKKLCQIFNIVTGKSKSKYINENGNNIIVDMGGISSEPRLIAKKYTFLDTDYLTTNDLVMPKDDIGGGLIIGKVVSIPENNKYICGDHIYKMTIKEGCIKYFQYVINSYSINKSFKQKANGTAQIGINKKEVDNQIVPFPCIEEQTKIANFLSAIDEEISLLEQKLEQLQLQKKGLMQGMFV